MLMVNCITHFQEIDTDVAQHVTGLITTFAMVRSSLNEIVGPLSDSIINYSYPP